MRKYHKYSDEDRDFLRTNITNMSYKEMAQRLEVTVRSVEEQCRVIGISRKSAISEKKAKMQKLIKKPKAESKDGDSLCCTCSEFFSCGWHPPQGEKRRRVWDLCVSRFHYDVANSHRYRVETVLECRLYEKGRAEKLSTQQYSKWQGGE